MGRGGHFGGGHYDGGFHGGYYGGHHPHGYSSFGLYVGPTWSAWGRPYYAPPYSPYYYPYYAHPPATVTAPGSPPVYIEQKSAPIQRRQPLPDGVFTAMPNLPKPLAWSVLLLLSACAAVPTGPSVLVLPGTGKNFDQFREDDLVCRQFASVQIGGRTPTQAASASGVGSAVIGTALGAATGAAIGGGEGAAIGAGTGLAAGSLVGIGEGSSSAGVAQQRYDMGYIQCMYAKGNRVPVPGNSMYEDRRDSYPPPPPPPR
jgi:hypothetical protein